MIRLDGVGVPFAGVMGVGSRHKRGENESVWVYGEIISPNFIRNDRCACRSHVEGIATSDGRIRLLESVYDFPYYEGDCCEWNLQTVGTYTDGTKVQGKIISRLSRNGDRPTSEGKLTAVLNPYWIDGEGNGERIAYSVPWNNRAIWTGTCLPRFFDSFLREIEESGFEHPYTEVTEKLRNERISSS